MMPARGRAVRLPARGVRAGGRLPLRLGALPGRPDRDDRRGRRRLRQVPGRARPLGLGGRTTWSSRWSSAGYALSLSTQQLVAVAMILLLTATNTRGLRTGKLIQNTFTVTKTAALAALIVARAAAGMEGGERGAGLVVVAPRGQRLARGGRAAGLIGVGRRLALAMLLGRGDGRPAVLAVGLEQRDLHRGRGARSRAATCRGRC